MNTPSSFPLSERQALLLVAFLSVFLLFPFLGDTLFNTRGEPREAVVALSMLRDGNWVLPVNNGIDIAYKPPLFHWCIAALSALAGGVTEYTSRAPSAIALTVMLLSGFLFYARRRGVEAAFVAALVTLTCFEVHRAGVNCRVDMLLTAFMVMALYAFYRWTERNLRGLPWPAVVCLGGAALVKGPVGVVLPCMVCGAYVLLRGGLTVRAFWKLLLTGVLGLVPLLLWYWAAYREPAGGQRFLELIYEENVLRFTGQMSYESHVNPWYYNVMTLVTGFLPYSLLLLVALPLLPVRRLRGVCLSAFGKEGFGRFAVRLRGMDPMRLYTLVCIVVMFVFYCIPKSKRSVYLLPLYPFIAYYVAEFLLYLNRRRPVFLRVWGGVLAVLAVALPVALVAVKNEWVTADIFSGRHAAENAAFLVALISEPIGVAQILYMLLPVWCILLLAYGRTLLYGCIGMVWSLFLSLDAVYQPPVLNVKSDKSVARCVAMIVPEGRIYSYRVENYDANRLHPFTVNFYLGDRVVPFDSFRPESGMLLADRYALPSFLAAWPDYEAEMVYDSYHRSCDEKSVLCLFRFWKKGAAAETDSEAEEYNLLSIHRKRR